MVGASVMGSRGGATGVGATGLAMAFGVFLHSTDAHPHRVNVVGLVASAHRRKGYPGQAPPTECWSSSYFAMVDDSKR